MLAGKFVASNERRPETGRQMWFRITKRIPIP
jgi:hypothetical protein